MSSSHAATGRLRRRLFGVRPNGRFAVPAAVVKELIGRVADQRRMLQLLLSACPAVRADSRRTWEALAVAFVRHADWRTGAITVPHETIAAEAAAACGRRRPFSHDTVGRLVAAAIAAGVFVCPDGMGGKSRRAFGGRRNQCPTYFVVDPDLRTPPAHVSEPVQVVDTHSLYKGPIRPKFEGFDPSVVPSTTAAQREGAAWLRARLLAGVVPNWKMTAMMARQFAAGLSPAEILRRVCSDPAGIGNLPLPVHASQRIAAEARSPHGSVADMLLGIIGSRLNRWRGVPPRPAPKREPQRPVPVSGRTSPRGDALASLAALGLRAGILRYQGNSA